MIDKSYLDNVQTHISEIEVQLADPAASSSPSKLKMLMTEHARLKRLFAITGEYFKVVDGIQESESLVSSADTEPELKEMALLELEELQAALPAAERSLQVALLPPDPNDERGTIVEIRAGTGGDEAALFAGDLYRMYNRFAERRGWKMSVIDASPSNVGGYREIICSIEGDDVFKTLRYESGGHRVQRIPTTEASGRIHTSAATVAVLPEADEIDEIEIKPEEVRVDIFRSSGPGGQSVNTTDSAVRLTNIEMGIIVTCQDEKSQHRNKDKAMRVLRARLLDRKGEEESAKVADQRRNQIGSGDRSQKVRTYNFPQNRVTDHRVNLTLHNLDRVMEGQLEELVETLYAHDIELRLKEHLAIT